METKNSLTIFTQAAHLLAEANTIQKAKDLKDLALTAADWAKRKGLGKEAVQYCESYSRRAEIRMGEMLLATERAKGTKGSFKGKDISGSYLALPPEDDPPTLLELGISKRESAEAQMMASAGEETQEEYITNKTSKTKVRRKKKAEEIKKKVCLPDAKYRVLYADPPWSYGNTQPDYQTEQRDHYPVMSLKEICELPVESICEDNAVLFLWVTSPILEESFEVVRAWGFKYKASFVWDKVKHNMGHYNSVRHEFLLICVRGSCQPDVAKLIDSVQTIERTKHSKKPVEFYKIIETLYHYGKKLELFARGNQKGWEQYGNQA